jgi:hypothetical protein
MILNAFTAFHVVLSLVGIGSGVVAIYAFLKAKTPGRWTQAFLATTAATSITGFLFSFHGVTPAQVLGVLSLVALIIASLSIYRHHLQGTWRRTYAITAVIAVHFNVFVLVVQLFHGVPALKAMAPTQSELPFAPPTMDPSFGIVEHAILGKNLIYGHASVRGVVFTEDILKIASQQRRYAVGHANIIRC